MTKTEKTAGIKYHLRGERHCRLRGLLVGGAVSTRAIWERRRDNYLDCRYRGRVREERRDRGWVERFHGF